MKLAGIGYVVLLGIYMLVSLYGNNVAKFIEMSRTPLNLVLLQGVLMVLLLVGFTSFSKKMFSYRCKRKLAGYCRNKK